MFARFFPKWSSHLTSTGVAILGVLTESAAALQQEIEADQQTTQQTAHHAGNSIAIAAVAGTLVTLVFAGSLWACVKCCRGASVVEVDEESRAINARTSARAADERAGFFP